MNPTPAQNDKKTKLLIQSVQYAAMSSDHLRLPAISYFDVKELCEALAQPTISESFLIEDLIQSLLADKTVQVDVKDDTGWPLIMSAVENEQVLDLLFTHRPDITLNLVNIRVIEPDNSNPDTPKKPPTRDPIIWDPFTWAAFNGETNSLKKLLAINSLSQELVDTKKIEIVSMFLKKNLEIGSIADNFISVLNTLNLPENKIAPFLFQAISDDALIAVRVLSKAPNINEATRDNEKRTPIMWAAESRRALCIQALLTVTDNNVNAQDDFGQTALMYAAKNGDTLSINALLKAENIAVNAADEMGCTALMYAAQTGDPRSVQKLLEAANIDVNAHDRGFGWNARRGNTALMWAVRKDHASCVKELLNASNINVNARDSNGHTALMLAAALNRHASLIELLKSPQLELITENQGEQAIALASNEESKKLIRAALAEVQGEAPLVPAFPTIPIVQFHPTDTSPEEPERSESRGTPRARK